MMRGRDKCLCVSVCVRVGSAIKDILSVTSMFQSSGCLVMSRLSFKQHVEQQQHDKHYDLHEHEVVDIHADTCGFKHANYFINSINLRDQGFHI